MIRHAGLLALRLDGYWRGVLIEGPSGAGKSDLALHCLDQGFRLVADDRTTVFAADGRLWGVAPPPLMDLIEARGVGVVREPAIRLAQIVLVARLAPPGESIERLPDPDVVSLCGINVPSLRLSPFEHTAPAKLRRGMEHLGAGEQQAYQPRHAPPRRRMGA